MMVSTVLALLLLKISQSCCDQVNVPLYELLEPYTNTSAFKAFPPVENFNDLMGYFLDSRNCFTILDNFKGIDLPQVQNPVFLRALKPSVLQIQFESINNAKQVVWTPKGVLFSNFTLQKGNRRCPQRTKLLFPMTLPFHPDDRSLDLCVALFLKTFASKTKPWNCQLHFSLFPPTSLFNVSNYARIFWLKSNYRAFENAFPSPTPPVHVLIKNDESQSLKSANENILQNWIWSTTQLNPVSKNHSFGSKISQDTFIVADTILSKSDQYNLLNTKHFTIISLQVLCPACSPKTLKKFRINMTAVQLSETLSLGYPTKNDLLRWTISSTDVTGINRGKLVPFYLNLCNPPERILWSDISFPTPLHRVSYAYAYIWRSLMGNYTIVNDNGLSCKNGIREFELKADSHNFPIRLDGFLYLNETLFDFPLITRDKLNRLKFVSCGRRNDAISFDVYQFINIYDAWVWLLILLSGTAFGCVFRFSKISGNFLIFLKLIVEQGSPFNASILRVSTWRHVIVPFLLAGIVLSNSYKITNIYSVIAPKKPIPYEKFKQLLSDNFTAYSRSIFPEIWDHQENHTRYLELSNEIPEGPREVLEFEDFSALLVSEVTVHLLMVRLTLGITGPIPASGGGFLSLENLLKSGILNSTQLHPAISSIARGLMSNITEILDKLFQLLAAAFGERLDLGRRIQNIFNEKQNNAIFRSLRECDQVAAILPEHLATRFAQRLEKINPGRVSLGKEVNSEADVAIKLEGHVPPHIVKNLKGLRASGVWEWWMDLVAGASIRVIGGDGPETTPNMFEQPNMTGNIALIFYFLGTGYVASLISCSLETVRLYLCRHSKTLSISSFTNSKN